MREESNTSTIVGIKPFARVVIRDGKTYMFEWSEWLYAGNINAGIYSLVADSGTVVVDLARSMGNGVRELFIVPVQDSPLDSAARAQLIELGKLTAYQRIWLDGGLGFVELDGLIPMGAEASVTCDVCGTEQRDSSIDFWRFVARAGRMPHFCPCCGFRGLPLWTVSATAADDDLATDAWIFGRDWEDGEWVADSEPATVMDLPNMVPADGVTLEELIAMDLEPGEEVVLDPTEWDGFTEAWNADGTPHEEEDC